MSAAVFYVFLLFCDQQGVDCKAGKSEQPYASLKDCQKAEPRFVAMFLAGTHPDNPRLWHACVPV